jgi:hypothetical protein
MQVHINSFSLSEDDAANQRAVELPFALTQFFQRFQLSNWSLSTQFTVSRETRSGDADAPVEAPVRWRGQAYISDASGAYDRFPYQLDGVDADVEYDNDRFRFHHTSHGRGSDQHAHTRGGRARRRSPS